MSFYSRELKGRQKSKQEGSHGSYKNDFEKDVLSDQDVWSWVDLAKFCGEDKFVTEITYGRRSVAVSINPIISTEVGPMAARKAFIVRISYHPRPSTVS